MSADHDNEVERIYLAQAWDGAVGAIKVAFALNGGAAVAILAFIGAMIDSPTKVNGEHISVVLLTFCGGLTAAAVAQLCAYFAVYSYHQNHGQSRLGKWTPAEIFGGIGSTFHLAGVVAVITAYVTFACGVGNFASFARLTLG